MEPTSLSHAFGIWAAVVALVGGGIVFELSRLRTELKGMADRLNEIVIEFEHRLTAVESDIRRCNLRQS
jgi:hypothetical protein